MNKKSLTRRLAAFFSSLALTLIVVFGVLPLLTRSCDVLQRMADHLDASGIDPSRYYYTDVEQVKESEQYLRSALDE